MKEQLLAIYTPEFPDILKLDKEIARQERAIKDLESQEAAPKEAAAKASIADPSTPLDKGETMQTAQIKSQLEINRLEMQRLLKEEQRLKTEMAVYQNKINQAPVREQQLADVVRDHDLLKTELRRPP